MAVSCADVASAYNTELMQNSINKHIGNITIAKATHLSNGGVWTEKQFNKTHPKYIRQVLSLLNKKTKKL
jgi:hypothetical protein